MIQCDFQRFQVAYCIHYYYFTFTWLDTFIQFRFQFIFFLFFFSLLIVVLSMAPKENSKPLPIHIVPLSFQRTGNTIMDLICFCATLTDKYVCKALSFRVVCIRSGAAYLYMYYLYVFFSAIFIIIVIILSLFYLVVGKLNAVPCRYHPLNQTYTCSMWTNIVFVYIHRCTLRTLLFDHSIRAIFKWTPTIQGTLPFQRLDIEMYETESNRKYLCQKLYLIRMVSIHKLGKSQFTNVVAVCTHAIRWQIIIINAINGFR